MNVEVLDAEIATGSTPLAATVRFDAGDPFQTELRRRVDAYFTRTGKNRRDCPGMYAKTAFILTCLVSSYLALVFLASAWWMAVPLCIFLGLVGAGVGFNIQHDGGHKAYSAHPWVNKLMALTLDLMGGSSYVWNRKHNSIHHSFTNITGHDDDIELGVMGRLSPHQPRRALHRFQHFYIWPLFGLLPVKWQFLDDFKAVATGRIGNLRLARPRGLDLAVLIAGKALFFTLAFIVPALFHPLWAVIACYLLISWVQGFTLSLVFQLAHCVEEAKFPMPCEQTQRMPTPWAVHQVETTVDFARRNRFISWYVGGLNFQIEHHLFPQICHVHYPALAAIVEETSKEFGVSYHSHERFFASVASHYRWLRRMGSED